MADITNGTFEKQYELTQRMLVHLLRSIGDMLCRMCNFVAGIKWLHAAKTIDPTAVQTLMSLAEVYRQQVQKNSTTDCLLDYIYHLSRACNVKKPYVIRKKFDVIKEILKKHINRDNVDGKTQLTTVIDCLQRYRKMMVTPEIGIYVKTELNKFSKNSPCVFPDLRIF